MERSANCFCVQLLTASRAGMVPTICRMHSRQKLSDRYGSGASVGEQAWLRSNNDDRCIRESRIRTTAHLKSGEWGFNSDRVLSDVKQLDNCDLLNSEKR